MVAIVSAAAEPAQHASTAAKIKGEDRCMRDAPWL
jgi:hypothetical protein